MNGLDARHSSPSLGSQPKLLMKKWSCQTTSATSPRAPAEAKCKQGEIIANSGPKPCELHTASLYRELVRLISQDGIRSSFGDYGHGRLL
ncbi:hypothetical protein BAUCODRAFT_38948 [Baudoinia panamericana UAMH 10762]|uniref:Uncharacterized protein n=1 Tax=Baudoinia panamericana (strain UAMH 10762) TaxID=717646 RepID=M2M5A8_BAUPA|nr:uncharacterized protein BAUCODRAFT_38948 [Baudoinia panamericana UAMH 10762]EMC91811.1 hypothetical protein BAUCODRAFT_38948 [Baudoinia panamericana UAMH 10762]